jgi:RNA polymerase sigma-70 factor (ECF subfamily)
VVDASKRRRSDHAAIYERMKARMLGMFGQRPWVQDVIQTAFESFLRKEHTFRGEGRIEAFADAIVLNAARDHMRRQKRSSFFLSLFAEHDEWPPLTRTPEAETADRDRIRRLQTILESLGPRYRLPYLLYYVENMPLAEIARVEGVSEEGIRKRITRARARIHSLARKDPVLAEWLETFRGEE